MIKSVTGNFPQVKLPRKIAPRENYLPREKIPTEYCLRKIVLRKIAPPPTNLLLEENHMGNSPPEDQLLTNLQLEDCQQKIAPRDDWEHNSVDSMMAQITFI